MARPRRSCAAALAAVLAAQLAVSVALEVLPRVSAGGWEEAGSFPPFRPAGIDFVTSYVAARRVAHGQDPYRTYPDDLEKLEVGGLPPEALAHVTQGDALPGPPGWRNLYGPGSAVLFLPFAAFEFPASYRLMTWISLAALSGAVLVLAAGLSADPAERWLAALLAGALVAGSYPLAFMLERGNAYTVLMLGVAAVAVLHARGRRGAAGAMLGVCAVMKASPAGLAMGWLVAQPGRRRALAAFLATVALGTFCLGVEPAREWWAVLREHGAVVGIGNAGHSFTVFTRLFDRARWWPWLSGWSAVMLVWTLVMQARTADHPEPAARIAGFLAPLPLLSLVVPMSNDYNLVLLALPYAAVVVLVCRQGLAVAGWRRPASRLALAGLALCAALLFAPPIAAEGRWALLLWQKTIAVMIFQVLLLLGMTIATGAPLIRRR